MASQQPSGSPVSICVARIVVTFLTLRSGRRPETFEQGFLYLGRENVSGWSNPSGKVDRPIAVPRTDIRDTGSGHNAK